MIKNHIAHPEAIYAIIPAIILFWFIIRKDFGLGKELSPGEKKGRRRIRRFMYFTRALIVIALLIAIASPFMVREKTVEGDAYIKILVDNSTSMELFDTRFVSQLESKLEKRMTVDVKQIAFGETSAIGSSVLNNLKNNENILLISDGNTNFGSDLGDVGLYAAKLNATISAISLNAAKNDVGVEIIGPSKTMKDVENTYRVRATKIGTVASYHLTVTVDGNTVIDEATSDSEKVFTARFGDGYHSIVAEVKTNDHFPQNNIFYKAVKVVPKPKILFYSEDESPLKTLLSQLYAVTHVTSISDSDLENYHAVVINDIDAGSLEPNVEKLTDYASEGNGIMVVGGTRSFDRGAYKDALIETILPVFVSRPGKKEGDINIAMLLDISGSTGTSLGSGDKAVDVEKALAVGILGDLSTDNKLGVIAFNTAAYIISPLSYISEKTNLESTIGRLKDGGGTVISAGLFEAIYMLQENSGSKNIILVSDGKTQLVNPAIEMANLAKEAGIKIYSIGVGATTNEALMQQFAEITNGVYFAADQSSKLRILFGDIEEGESDRMGIEILDSNHFITENVAFVPGIVTGYNQVVPKTTAQLIVTTSTGDPLLTVWRFGLGRVAAFTTDDGGRWAGELLNSQNSHLVTRTLNWAIGDPDRKSERYIIVSDTRLNQTAEVTIKSPEPPQAGELRFYQAGDGIYHTTLYPKTTGFHDAAGARFAVNYNDEYANLGVSPIIEKIVATTKGKIFNPDDIDSIVDHVKSVSKRREMKRDFIRYPFLAFAILIFLIEAFVRRIAENRMMVNR